MVFGFYFMIVSFRPNIMLVVDYKMFENRDRRHGMSWYCPVPRPL